MNSIDEQVLKMVRDVNDSGPGFILGLADEKLVDGKSGLDIRVSRPLDFLLMWKHTLDDPEMLESMRSVSARAEIKADSDLQEDGDKIGYFVKTTAGDELKTFPKEFKVVLPVFDDDVVDQIRWVPVDVTLIINIPEDPRQGVKFILRSADWMVRHRERVAKEVQFLIENLGEGWTILRGTPAYEEDKLKVSLRNDGD